MLSTAFVRSGILFPPRCSVPILRRWSPPPAHVVVAMGTMGGRVHYLVRSLPTLLSQTYPVDHVIVSISKYDDMDLMLRQLEQFGPFSNFTPSSDSSDALSHYSSSIKENKRLNSTSSLSPSSPILIKGRYQRCSISFFLSCPQISLTTSTSDPPFLIFPHHYFLHLSPLSTRTGQRGLLLQFMSKDSGGPGDWGPGTKLVAAFLLVGPRKDTVIITLDDDCR